MESWFQGFCRILESVNGKKERKEKEGEVEFFSSTDVVVVVGLKWKFGRTLGGGVRLGC